MLLRRNVGTGARETLTELGENAEISQRLDGGLGSRAEFAVGHQ